MSTIDRATSDQPRTRQPAVDDLKTVLVAWVIGGHALLGYSAVGGWPYDEVRETTLTPQVELALMAALGPSGLFFMGTFFFLAGLFTPGSLHRRGPRRFARERTVRLGVPFVVSAVVLWPASMLLAYRSAGHDVGYWWVLTQRDHVLDSGSLWFAEVLLLFSLGYAAWARYGHRLPVWRDHWLPVAVVVIAVTTFLVRLAFPARSGQPGDLHLWQWPQLAGMFVLGLLAADTGIVGRVPEALARRSKSITAAVLVLIAVVALGVIVVRGGMPDVTPFLGGPHWQALALAVAEAVLVVFGSVALLGVAQRLPGRWRLSRSTRRAAFAAFVLQGPVLVATSVALRPLALPAEAKALVAAVVGIVASFGIGHVLVTRTPLRQVLGG
ncbi:acyltransferase [Lentzea sp. NPDC004782]|uniref:acyltransferase family protein n=1 Tax=Lentzea sp. NPDC004782 TaxID=3154458 RepID=UPI00339FF06D